ncbi:unnamed protein product, partial [Bubo scandiacus]
AGVTKNFTTFQTKIKSFFFLQDRLCLQIRSFKSYGTCTCISECSLSDKCFPIPKDCVICYLYLPVSFSIAPES